MLKLKNSFFKTADVKEKFIRDALSKISARSAYSVPFQFALFGLTVLSIPEFRETLISKILLVVLIVNALVRIATWRWRNEILASNNGIQKFRALFALAMVLVGSFWGTTSSYFICQYGLTSTTAAIVIAVLGTAATMIAYSFELQLSLLGQMLMLVPPAVCLFFHPDHDGSRTVSFVAGIYPLYMFAITMGFHQTQVKLFKSAEEIEAKEETLRSVYDELSRNHNLVHSMLESIDEAYIIFDRDGVCISTPSATAMAMLGLDLISKSLTDVLRVPEKDVGSVKSWYELLCSDQFEFQTLAGSGPSLLKIGEPERILKIAYHPMRDSKNQLFAVSLTANDITREVLANVRTTEERERADMILRIMESKPAFRSFLRDLETFFGQDLKKVKTQDLRRLLHDLKGAAMMFGASSFGRCVYAMELKLKECKGDLEECAEDAKRELEKDYSTWSQKMNQLFTQLGVYEELTFEVSHRKLRQIESSYAAQPEKLEIFRNFKQTLALSDVSEMVDSYIPHVQSTAAKLGKNAALEIAAASERILIPPGTYREVFRTFIHIFNNALDHGIEAPNVRAERGKPAQGRIEVTCQRETRNGKEWLRVLIQDDGGGIDIERLRAILERKGRPVPEDMPKLEVAMKVFEVGISTKVTTSELSGQGVGMGAVRSAIQKVKGKIAILKTDASGTQFEILLPDVPAPNQTAKSA